MSESNVAVTEGAGKKLHTNQRSIGGNTVEDEYMLVGEPFLATYVLPTGASTSIATANDHVIQVMAGASLNVYIRRIQVWQSVLATTAAITSWDIFTLSSAGTGGTVLTNRAFDSTDAGAGATGMSLPTVKGTEVGRMWVGQTTVMQTAPTAGGSNLLFDINFEQLRTKALRIPAGTANGIALKILTATAGASVRVAVYFSEANY